MCGARRKSDSRLASVYLQNTELRAEFNDIEKMNDLPNYPIFQGSPHQGVLVIREEPLDINVTQKNEMSSRIAANAYDITPFESGNNSYRVEKQQ